MNSDYYVLAAIVVLALCSILQTFYPVRDQRGRISAYGWIIIGLTVFSVVGGLIKERERQQISSIRSEDRKSRLDDVRLHLGVSIRTDAFSELDKIALFRLSKDEATDFLRLFSFQASSETVELNLSKAQIALKPLLPYLTSEAFLDDRRAARDGAYLCTHSWRFHLVRDFKQISQMAERIKSEHAAHIPFALSKRLEIIAVASKSIAEIWEKSEEERKGKDYITNSLPFLFQNIAEASGMVRRLDEQWPEVHH